MTAPTAINFNGAIQLFAISTRGELWNWAYPCGGSWCTPWSMTAAFGGTPTLAQYSRVAVLIFGGYMQLFAVSSGGMLENFSGAASVSPCYGGAQGVNGWCPPYGMIGGPAISPTAGITALVTGGTMRAFAASSTGVMEDFRYTCTQGTFGWCAPEPLDQTYTISAESEIAAILHGGAIQLFGISGSGVLRYFYAGGCYSNNDDGLCEQDLQGNGLSSSAGIAVTDFRSYMQLFAIGSDGSLQDYAGAKGTSGCTPTQLGWCLPFSITGATLSQTANVAFAVWGGTMQVFALANTNGSLENYSGTNTCGGGNHGFCVANMSNGFSDV